MNSIENLYVILDIIHLLHYPWKIEGELYPENMFRWQINVIIQGKCSPDQFKGSIIWAKWILFRNNKIYYP